MACGPYPQRGYEGVDVVPLEGVAHVVDLNAYPWPWPDESVAALWCSHFVEHVADLIAFMEEAYRIAEPGARFSIRHPYQHSNRAWQDPTHVRALNEVSWAYFGAEGRRGLGVEHYGIKCDWATVSIQFVLAPEWAAKRQAAEEAGREFDLSAVRYGVNIVDDLAVVLEAVKFGGCD